MNYTNIGNKYIFFSLLLLGAILPDIDCPKSKISNKIPVIPRILSLLSKHRGIFHSVPSCLITILLSSLILRVTEYTSLEIMIISVSVGLGFFSHLLLDEIFSAINFEGLSITPKKSFGTAITFTGIDIVSTIFVYLLLVVLILINIDICHEALILLGKS